MKRVSGLDVHKDSVYLCILQENGEKIEEKFGTLTPELHRLRATLLQHHVEEVAMESTSIYWIPIWNLLIADFQIKLVNPYFIKQLPGR
ncbi:MAG: transposase, partial [Paludibacter sp.]|nr:transposase [Paludibacter sp.]